MTRGHVNHHPIDRVKVKEGDAVVDVTLVGSETPGAQKQALEEGPQLVFFLLMGHPGGLETVLVKARFFWEHERRRCRLCMVSCEMCEMLERTSLIC